MLFQACHVEGGSAGLIPSQLLEEKRKAFVKRDLELTPTSGRSPPPSTPPPSSVPTSGPNLRPGVAQFSYSLVLVARDPMWQPFRKEKEANDVFDYQERRWV